VPAHVRTRRTASAGACPSDDVVPCHDSVRSAAAAMLYSKHAGAPAFKRLPSFLRAPSSAPPHLFKTSSRTSNHEEWHGAAPATAALDRSTVGNLPVEAEEVEFFFGNSACSAAPGAIGGLARCRVGSQASTDDAESSPRRVRCGHCCKSSGAPERVRPDDCGVGLRHGEPRLTLSSHDLFEMGEQERRRWAEVNGGPTATTLKRVGTSVPNDLYLCGSESHSSADASDGAACATHNQPSPLHSTVVMGARSPPKVDLLAVGLRRAHTDH